MSIQSNKESAGHSHSDNIDVEKVTKYVSDSSEKRFVSKVLGKMGQEHIPNDLANSNGDVNGAEDPVSCENSRLSNSNSLKSNSDKEYPELEKELSKCFPDFSVNEIRRFIQARKGDVDKAQDMLKNSQEWRRDVGTPEAQAAAWAKIEPQGVFNRGGKSYDGTTVMYTFSRFVSNFNRI